MLLCSESVTMKDYGDPFRLGMNGVLRILRVNWLVYFIIFWLNNVL